MTSCGVGKLHLFVTSRPEEEIVKHLRLLDPDHVIMRPEFVAQDIAKYIDHMLYVEDGFDRWNEEVKVNIKKTLLENAGGMYVCFSIEMYNLTTRQGSDWLRCRLTNCKNAIMKMSWRIS